MTRVMLVGPYGGRNIGDNLILEMILGELKKFDIDVLVSCSDPHIVRELYSVDTTSLLEYRSLTTESLKLLKHVDGVIIGGGEQLSEPRIANPIWGHLARTAHIARVAKKNALPFMLWAVGLDVIRSPISCWLIRKWICAPGHIITLRDTASVMRMQKIAPVADIDFIETADPAFDLPRQDKITSRQWLYSELDIPLDEKKLLLLVPANDKRTSLSYIDELIDFGCRMALNGYRVIGWVTDLQAAYDIVLADQADWQRIACFHWLPRVLYKKEAFSMIVNAMDIVVSARMHPLIGAYTQLTPSISLSRSAKMDAFAATYNVRQLNINNITAQLLYEYCIEIENMPKSINNKQYAKPKIAPISPSKIFVDRMLPVLK